jgi:hypothetical protein
MGAALICIKSMKAQVIAPRAVRFGFGRCLISVNALRLAE